MFCVSSLTIIALFILLPILVVLLQIFLDWLLEKLGIKLKIRTYLDRITSNSSLIECISEHKFKTIIDLEILEPDYIKTTLLNYARLKS